jgi:hypothetical protein
VEFQTKLLGCGGIRRGHRHRLDACVIGHFDETAVMHTVAAIFAAAAGFALILDQIKAPIVSMFKVGSGVRK